VSTPADVAGEVEVGRVAVDEAARAEPAGGHGERRRVARGDRAAVAAAAQDRPGQAAAVEGRRLRDRHLDAAARRRSKAVGRVCTTSGTSRRAGRAAAGPADQPSQPTVCSTSSTQRCSRAGRARRAAGRCRATRGW
jgi:hypothetical protein